MKFEVEHKQTSKSKFTFTFDEVRVKVLDNDIERERDILNRGETNEITNKTRM